MTVSPPADPAIRAFLDQIAEILADQLVRELRSKSETKENHP